MVGIVADSAANIPEELARELAIELVPMYLEFGDRAYRDGRDIRPADFYRRLSSGESASSAAPSPGDFLEAFERARSREIVCVTVAGSMSASNHAARMAAERFSGRADIVDSRSASMAEGFVAIAAARAAGKGASIDEVGDEARRIAIEARLIATVDTFEFLRRSGRVTALQAWAATVLDMKPVFAFRDGRPGPVARPRTRKRALDRVVQETLAEAGGRAVHLAVVHAGVEAEARAVADRVGVGADVVELVVVEATPVIGAHTGPGLLGTAFYCE